jgi:hypothetical protein
MALQRRPKVPTPICYSYAVIRAVPRVEREEFLNCGVILFSLERKYLAALIHLDRPRLQLLSPATDLTELASQLDAIGRIAQGDPAAGPIALLPVRERFHWLVSPRSTIVQVSPVHVGLSTDPGQTLIHLFNSLVGNLESGAPGHAR